MAVESPPTPSTREKIGANVIIARAQARLAKALKIPIERFFVPASVGVAGDDEIARRRALPRTERVNARALHAAIEEAAGRKSKAPAKKQPRVRG